MAEEQPSREELLLEIERLQAELAVVKQEKADLEILLQTTTEHGDIIEELLHNQSIRDPLTGLYNRRYLERSLNKQLQLAHIKDEPLGVVMADIDHFQRFNNSFGHEAGDMVLREVGLFLHRNIRAADIACRYGGEEIILILPNTTLEDAAQQTEQLRQGVKRLNLHHLNLQLEAITISFGVAGFPAHGQSAPELINAADTALYYAKNQGRDRVVTAPSVANWSCLTSTLKLESESDAL